ncbi:hypothetical protein [Lederbergia ruris]
MTSAIILTGQGIGEIRNRQKRLDLDKILIGSWDWIAIGTPSNFT